MYVAVSYAHVITVLRILAYEIARHQSTTRNVGRLCKTTTGPTDGLWLVGGAADGRYTRTDITITLNPNPTAGVADGFFYIMRSAQGR